MRAQTQCGTTLTQIQCVFHESEKLHCNNFRLFYLTFHFNSHIDANLMTIAFEIQFYSSNHPPSPSSIYCLAGSRGFNSDRFGKTESQNKWCQPTNYTPFSLLLLHSCVISCFFGCCAVSICFLMSSSVPVSYLFGKIIPSWKIDSYNFDKIANIL